MNLPLVTQTCWENSTRTLASGTPGTPTTLAEVIAEAIWEAATRELNFIGDDWAGYDEVTLANPASALTDFTYVLSLNQLSSDWHTNVASDGSDINIRTISDNRRLPADLISYDSGTNSGLVAFKFSPASSGTQKFRVWAGKSGQTFPADNTPYGADNAYASHVKYFSPDGNHLDRTVNAISLTMTGSPTTSGGPINGSIRTNYGGGKYASGSMTWPSTFAPTTFVVMGYNTSGTLSCYAMGMSNSGDGNTRMRLAFSGATAGNPIEAAARTSAGNSDAESTNGYTASVWCHAAARYNSTTSREAACDGIVSGLATGSRNFAADTLTVGGGAPASGEFNGGISFVCIHNIALSNDWIAYHKLMFDAANQSNIYTQGGWTDSGGGGYTGVNYHGGFFLF